MKVFVDNDQNSVALVQSVASASTMISSIAAEAKDYILSHFRKGFFKKVYIDTAQTVSEQKKNDLYDKTANKIPYPSMSITPELSLDDPIGGMAKSLHLANPNLYIRKDINRTYKKLIIDPEDQFSVYYTADYITTNFNFKITTNSFIQNADAAFFLKSRFQTGFFQYLNDRHIQTEIPKTFIHLISTIKGYDMNNATDMDALRLYLIGTSKTNQTIQKRVNNGTGKDCFFVDDQVNFLTVLEDIDCPPSIVRSQQIEDEYILSFRLQVSTYIPNAFIMRINKEKLKIIEKTVIEDIDSNDNNDTLTFSAPLTFSNTLGLTDAIEFYDASGNIQMGQRIYSDKFMHELNKPIGDIELMPRMKKDLKRVLAYASENEIDLSALVHAVLCCRDINVGKSGKLTEKEFSFDIENMVLHVDEDIDSDISVNIYLNRLLYESLLKAMENDEYFFSNSYITSMLARINGKDVKLVVREFKNERDMASMDKPLRLMTPYGIGYVGLLEDSNEDSYKICVGYKDNEPIIKRLEIKKEG